MTVDPKSLSKVVGELATADPLRASLDLRTLARRGDDWPPFFDLCIALHRAGRGKNDEFAVTRLAAKERVFRLTVEQEARGRWVTVALDQPDLLARVARLTGLIERWLKGEVASPQAPLDERLLDETVVELRAVPHMPDGRHNASVAVLLGSATRMAVGRASWSA